MGQYWKIVSLDAEQTIEPDMCKLGEILFSPLDYISILLTRRTFSPVSSEQLRKWIIMSASRMSDREQPASANVGLNQATISSVPNELLLEIFENISNAADAVSFGLTTENMWRVGERHIASLIATQIAPWAGTRIICVGDYCDPGDLPPGLVLDSKHDQWLKRRGETIYGLSCKFPSPETAELFLNTTPHSTELVDGSSYDPMLKNRLLALNSEVEQWILGDDDDEDCLLLRNLTEKVYVRQEATPISLPNVLVAHICWSADPSVSMTNDNDIHRGVWAGDRFDICTMEAHEEELADLNEQARDSWKDVSDNIAEEMEAIWRSNFDDDWEQFVC